MRLFAFAVAWLFAVAAFAADFTIHPDRVIADDFVGFGCQFNGWLYCKPNWGEGGGEGGVNEQNVKDLEAKMIELGPQHVRIGRVGNIRSMLKVMTPLGGFARVSDAVVRRHVNATFKVPAQAKLAQMELRLRWSPQGEVEWRDAGLKPAEAPASRMVKVASVNHRPRGTKSPQQNLEQFAKLVDEAGASKSDIVCLPEGITLIGTGKDYLSCAEPVPGPSTEFLGKCAAKNKINIVAGIYERDGNAAYNTAVLIGRDGKLIGKYRKICLPRGEIDGGLAPGKDYPVFDTDFGKVGMMICWDVSYPEIARELAARGAEIILMPIWGGNETLCRARAIENQVPLVISSYDLRSAVYDQAGEPKAQAKDASTCVVYADLNLAEAMDWKWTGHWRDRIWMEGPVRKDASE